MDDWMDVAAAARLLEVSPRQVRSLVERGALPAQRVGGSWLVGGKDVRSRAAHAPTAGRPVTPDLAWHLLAVVQHQLERDTDDEPAGMGSLDRRQRHRIRQLLAAPTSASTWMRRLSRRAERRPYWAHPGALPRLAEDSRLRAGGRLAAAAAGEDVAAAHPERFYVDADDLDAVVADYRLSADPAGSLVLMIVPEGVPRDLLDGKGPLPNAVALADLLESDDARERGEAALRLERVVLWPKR